MTTVNIKFIEDDYTRFVVSATKGYLYGAFEYEMKPAGTNLPASCYLEFSNGFLLKIVSQPGGSVVFAPARNINEVSGILGFFQVISQGEISFDSSVRWVRIWADYPMHRDELLKAIEEMALEETRVLSLSFEDIQDIYNRFFIAMSTKFWERKSRESKST